jgi:hypothetical protein
LNRVVDFAALAVFTATLPNVRLVGETMVGFTPVPLSGTVFGLIVELLAIDSVPAGCAPVADGFSVTSTVQLAPAASVVTVLKHVPPLVTAYGVPAVTVGAAPILIEAVPVFLKVIAWTALAVPVATLPKFTAVGLTVLCAPDKVEVKIMAIAVSVCRTPLFHLHRRLLPRSNMDFLHSLQSVAAIGGKSARSKGPRLFAAAHI